MTSAVMRDKTSTTIFDRVMDRIRQAVRSKDDKKIDEELEKAKDTLAEITDEAAEEKAEEKKAEDRKSKKAKDAEEEEKKKKEEEEKMKDALGSKLAGVFDGIMKRLDAIDKRFKDKDDEEEKKKAEDALLLTGEEDPEPKATGDRARGRTRQRDSSHLEDAFEDCLSKAEILAPGTGGPVYDSARPAKDTIEAMCGFRRRVLKKAYDTEDGRGAIEAIAGQKALDSIQAMTCDAVTTLYNGAAAMIKAVNSNSVFARSVSAGGNGTSDKKAMTIADINAANRKRFNQPER